MSDQKKKEKINSKIIADVIKILPKNKAELEKLIQEIEAGTLEFEDYEDKQKIESFFEASSYSGPMPSPEHLMQYENIHTGASKIFFDMLRKQYEILEKRTDANIKLENDSLEKNYNIAIQKLNINKRGQIFAFSLSVLTFITGFILAWNNHTESAVALFSISLGTTVIAFLTNKVQKKQSNNSIISEEDK